MPVAAVGAAVFAGSSIAAAGGIAAFAAASGVFSAIAAVGTIVSAVGVVTGSKALTNLGGAAALAGGIGSFAQSQGWISGELAAGDVASTAGDFARADRAADAASAAAETSNTSQMIAQAAPGVEVPSTGEFARLDRAGESGLINVQDSITAPTQVAGDVFTRAGDSQQAYSSGAAYSTQGAKQAVSGGVFDVLKDVGGFMKENPVLANMGLSFIGGALDKKKAAEADAAAASVGLYNARTQSELLQTDILRQQTANANSVPDLTGLKVNPNANVYAKKKAPTYYGPRAAGLINS